MGKKIAVKVASSSELKTFVKYCEMACFMMSEYCENVYMPEFPYWPYGDSFCGFNEQTSDFKDYEIISFEAFSTLKGVGLTPDPVTIEMTNEFTATVYPDKVDIFSPVRTFCTLTKQEVTEIFTAMKAFKP